MKMYEGGSNDILPVIYYWDDNVSANRGWWIGTEVGGTQVRPRPARTAGRVQVGTEQVA